MDMKQTPAHFQDGPAAPARPSPLFYCLLATVYCLLVLLPGCGTDLGLSGSSATVTPIPAGAVSEVEYNDTFNQAQSVPVTQSLTISGTITDANDVDVFVLGSFQAGQTLTADLTGRRGFGSNEVAVAFFDQDQDVAVLNDQVVTAAAGETASFTVRKAGNYYLALSQIDSAALPYLVAISVGSATIPTPQKQIVYLDYNGISSVQIGGDSFTSVQPFSAVGPSAAAMAARITTLVRTDYARYNVQILSSYESAAPADPHTTVYVSGSSGDFFGLADDVDWYNQNATDRAIIFAGLFQQSQLTQDQFVLGTANVVAHELGHLLGLAHTTDHTELMDQTTPMSLLVLDQTFHRAALAEFPIGEEDTPQLLLYSLGLL